MAGVATRSISSMICRTSAWLQRSSPRPAEPGLRLPDDWVHLRMQRGRQLVDLALAAAVAIAGQEAWLLNLDQRRHLAIEAQLQPGEAGVLGVEPGRE